MLFSEIISTTHADLLGKEQDGEISVLAFDTRKLVSKQEVLFLALPGTTRDGHRYIRQAYDKGVRFFLVSQQPDMNETPEATFALVSDVLSALQKVAIGHRSKFDIPVVGITGSNGKTMVKEWLAEVLGMHFQVVKSPKSYNSQMGVPISVWGMSEQNNLGIFEAGISSSGDMENLARVIQPSIGIFTNIGNAHDEGFNSLDQKIKEKALLFEESNVVVCSKDQTKLYTKLEAILGEKLFSWSLGDKKADIAFTSETEQIVAKYRDSEYTFYISGRDFPYVENIFHVIATAIYLGLSETEIESGLKRIKPVPMRLEIKHGIRDCYLVDDSYNNDLAGLSIALDYLKQQPHKKRKTVILSDIQQSGMPDVKLYEKVNELLVANNVLRLIGVGPHMNACRSQFSIDATIFETVTDLIAQMPAFENELILIKGARSFALERVVALLEEKNHGTILEVNFEALTHNLNVYRRKLSRQTRMMVMVKAFAYGGGLGEIAHLLQYEKVDYLGVAYTDEGVELRQKGITLPIMVMNPDWKHFDLLETFNLEPEIYSSNMLRELLDACDNPPPIHIKIETGMNRLGLRPDELHEFLEILAMNPTLRVAGVFTHFSSAEESSEDEYTQWQATQFEEAYDIITEFLGHCPMKYALNSAGILRWPQFHFDMVRLGIGLYGHDSSGTLTDLKPVSALKSRISQVRSIRRGESIGYSRMGRAESDGQIAVVSIGYADGYLRMFGRGRGYMLVNGQKAHTIGNVCMDMTILDVTGLNVEEGDEVIVFGKDPSIENLATWAQTIPYEILTNVSQRVKRVFVSE
ncbi:bifunctional UDP-N-acetylmuramoyl-tripeptide:D-alanyl-D-alanine ligase/alanine racemase [Marinoscillum sp. MHG1-6]|uniref:bifunctional UDP-N-acetylmuramoyl-tripeptide:D-alanyl-D-alanine ligase/alanine racemase n=1 Tax=Marinoscillum sp. MHG1-6 TaxID=2959627 RepID=UPI00215773EC|nr:bifunctional UDP-N-acetylmuramoyl-tripeptide:D-alanyl-D-alanine ligase/alanine racemase [Marinoscillum sp. MHG1-6]